LGADVFEVGVREKRLERWRAGEVVVVAEHDDVRLAGFEERAVDARDLAGLLLTQLGGDLRRPVPLALQVVDQDDEPVALLGSGRRTPEVVELPGMVALAKVPSRKPFAVSSYSFKYLGSRFGDFVVGFGA
jgi:hypothetical protein